MRRKLRVIRRISLLHGGKVGCSARVELRCVPVPCVTVFSQFSIHLLLPRQHEQGSEKSDQQRKPHPKTSPESDFQPLAVNVCARNWSGTGGYLARRRFRRFSAGCSGRLRTGWRGRRSTCGLPNRDEGVSFVEAGSVLNQRSRSLF